MNPDQDPAPADCDDETRPAPTPCVMTFNANDPSGAGGLAADLTAMASASSHVLPVVTAVRLGDTRQVRHHLPLPEDSIEEQARAGLEDAGVQAFKIGEAGNAANLLAIARVLGDYDGVPVIGYMPDLPWYVDQDLEEYHDTYAQAVLPHVTVLVGHHQTLWRWLLPDWEADRPPNGRELARAAASFGTPYTLVTDMPELEGWLDHQLASPETVLVSVRQPRSTTTFGGAGDTLTAALCALLACGHGLPEACTEALNYLDRSLAAAFRPGMGHPIPDRLFWAHDPHNGAETPDTEPPPPESGHDLLAGLAQDATAH